MKTATVNTEVFEPLQSQYAMTEVSSLDGNSLAEVVVRPAADWKQKLAVTSGTITVW